MKVAEVKLSDIKPYDKNPRCNNSAVDDVAESIKAFGFRQPILLDAEGVIIVGHTRWKAAKKLGLKTAPCVYAIDMTPEQARAYRLADNKVAEKSRWDDDLLSGELEALLDSYDMTAFGFDLIFKVTDGGDDFDPTPPVAAVSQRGDVYEMGAHRLVCGDATNADDMRLLMGTEQAHLLLTDPPYNVNYEGSAGKIKNDNMDEDAFRAFLAVAFRVSADALVPGGVFYVWYASAGGAHAVRFALRDAGLTTRQVVIWVKNNPSIGWSDYQWKHEPCLAGDKDAEAASYGWKDGAAHLWRAGRKQTTVLEFDRPARSAEHPTMKPIPLFSRLIESNTQDGAIVLDPFCGSGTTLIACERLGRVARVMELDPRYCDVIAKRWEAETGKEARLVRGVDHGGDR